MDRFYIILIALCIFFIYIEIKNKKEHKQKNIKILYLLERDEKATRFICKAMLVLMIIVSVFFMMSSITSDDANSSNSLIRLLIPVFIIVVYIPFLKKTQITSLGVYKRMKFLNWENVKRVKYFNPTKKGVIYVNVIGENTTIKLAFNEDSELETFKNTISEYVKE